MLHRYNPVIKHRYVWYIECGSRKLSSIEVGPHVITDMYSIYINLISNLTCVPVLRFEESINKCRQEN